MRFHTLTLSLLAAATLAACGGKDSTPPEPPVVAKPTPTNVIFFLGDGMGIATTTAARIYSVGEDGELTMDTLPETGFVKTFSNDAQVTDSAPSMSAYMTGVKMNNEVISMSTDTVAKSPNADFTSNCGTANGTPVTTLLELAKAAGRGTGVVTTTRVTHATPAATYAHVCHRDAEADIAAAMVPAGKGYNTKLADGIDVVLGGGKQFFLTTDAGGKRADKRDLTAELKTAGYTVATDRAGFDAIDATKAGKFVGLFTSSHMSYDLDRDPAKEPSLAEMTQGTQPRGDDGQGDPAPEAEREGLLPDGGRRPYRPCAARDHREEGAAGHDRLRQRDQGRAGRDEEDRPDAEEHAGRRHRRP